MTLLEAILGTGLAVVASFSAVAHSVSSRSRKSFLVSGEKEDRAAREKLRMSVLSERARIVKAIEEERGTKVITLIHRREPWLRPGEAGYITIEDTEHVLAEIRRTPK